MIIYNITVKVDIGVADDWLEWMKSVHIPDVLKTGLFSGYRMTRLLELDESDGITFSIQYSCENMENYMKYKHEFADKLQKEHSERFRNRFVAFRSLMRTV